MALALLIWGLILIPEACRVLETVLVQQVLPAHI